VLLAYEVLLMGAVVGLYLYDSSSLLYVNEGVLIPRGGKHWTVAFGSDKARISGKELFVPNPLVPHRPMFRLSWKFEGESGRHRRDWTGRVEAFGPLIPLVWAMVAALFLLLPLGLFTRLGEQMVLAAVALLYLSIAVSLVWMWINRARLEISPRKLAALAFESLACSPFALNLVRKLSMGLRIDEDLVSAACRLQDAEGWRATRGEMIARLDEEIEGEDADSPRALALKAHRLKLSERDAECRSPRS
jgi:hypothetical protein